MMKFNKLLYSLPYFTLSEASKYKVNKSGYITDAKIKVR